MGHAREMVLLVGFLTLAVTSAHSDVNLSKYAKMELAVIDCHSRQIHCVPGVDLCDQYIQSIDEEGKQFWVLAKQERTAVLRRISFEGEVLEQTDLMRPFSDAGMHIEDVEKVLPWKSARSLLVVPVQRGIWLLDLTTMGLKRIREPNRDESYLRVSADEVIVNCRNMLQSLALPTGDVQVVYKPKDVDTEIYTWDLSTDGRHLVFKEGENRSFAECRACVLNTKTHEVTPLCSSRVFEAGSVLKWTDDGRHLVALAKNGVIVYSLTGEVERRTADPTLVQGDLACVDGCRFVTFSVVPEERRHKLLVRTIDVASREELNQTVPIPMFMIEGYTPMTPADAGRRVILEYMGVRLRPDQPGEDLLRLDYANEGAELRCTLSGMNQAEAGEVFLVKGAVQREHYDRDMPVAAAQLNSGRTATLNVGGLPPGNYTLFGMASGENGSRVALAGVSFTKSAGNH